MKHVHFTPSGSCYYFFLAMISILAIFTLQLSCSMCPGETESWALSKTKGIAVCREPVAERALSAGQSLHHWWRKVVYSVGKKPARDPRSYEAQTVEGSSFLLEAGRRAGGQHVMLWPRRAGMAPPHMVCCAVEEANDVVNSACWRQKWGHDIHLTPC